MELLKVRFVVYRTSCCYEISCGRTLVMEDIGSGLPPKYITKMDQIGNEITVEMRKDEYKHFASLCKRANTLSSEAEHYTDGTYDFDLDAYCKTAEELSEVREKIFSTLLKDAK